MGAEGAGAADGMVKGGAAVAGGAVEMEGDGFDGAKDASGASTVGRPLGEGLGTVRRGEEGGVEDVDDESEDSPEGDKLTGMCAGFAASPAVAGEGDDAAVAVASPVC